MEERKQFTFYENLYEVVRMMDDAAERAAAYDAICAFALYGEEPDLDAMPRIAAVAFVAIRQGLEAGRRRAQCGKRGGDQKSAGGAEQDEARENGKSAAAEERGEDAPDQIPDENARAETAEQPGCIIYLAPEIAVGKRDAPTVSQAAVSGTGGKQAGNGAAMDTYLIKHGREAPEPAERTAGAPPQEARLQLGEYGNVYMTRAEYDRLAADFPRHAARYIDRLSRYIASKGARYRDHCATVRDWLNRDGVQAASTLAAEQRDDTARAMRMVQQLARQQEAAT